MLVTPNTRKFIAVVFCILAILAALGIAKISTAFAEETTPPTITVEVPAKPSKQEIFARIKAATPEGKLVRVHVQVNAALKPLTSGNAAAQSTNPITATTTMTVELNWNKNVQNAYTTATAADLSPTLTYNVYTNTLEVVAYSWINYSRDGNSEFYEDFDYIRVQATGAGVITISIPTYTPRPGYEQDGMFTGFIANPNGSYEYLVEKTIHFKSHQRLYLPITQR